LEAEHEQHAVASWDLGKHLCVCFKADGGGIMSRDFRNKINTKIFEDSVRTAQ